LTVHHSTATVPTRKADIIQLYLSSAIKDHPCTFRSFPVITMKGHG
jgi:hypothetical protein